MAAFSVIFFEYYCCDLTAKFATKTFKLPFTDQYDFYHNTDYKIGSLNNVFRNYFLVSCCYTISYCLCNSVVISAWSGLQFFGLGRASVQTIGLRPSRAFNDFNFFGLWLFGLCLERAFGLKLLNIFLKMETFFQFLLF